MPVVNLSTITSANPYLVTLPGEYKFYGRTMDSFANGAAIFIQNDDVTLDFQNGVILNSFGTANLCSAIVCDQPRSNITIKNLNMRGFCFGINIRGVDDVLIENVSGSSFYRHIVVDGTGSSTVKNCRVSACGLANPSAAYTIAIGIEQNTTMAYTEDCSISRVAHRIVNGVQGESVGLSYRQYGFAKNCKIHNINQLNNSYAVWTNGRSVIRDCDIISYKYGIAGTNEYSRDNTFINVQIPYSGTVTSLGGDYIAT